MNYTMMCDFLDKNLREATELYLAKNFTAKMLAEHYNILFNRNFQKACFMTIGDKGMGLGGARKGAGKFAVKDHDIVVKRRKPPKEVLVLSLSKNAIKALKDRLKVGESHSELIERMLLDTV